MKRIFIITIILSSFVKLLSAQCCDCIDSLYLLPQQPNSTDEIQLICNAVFCYGPCALDSSNIIFNLNNFEIKINAYHITGIAPAYCYSADTFNIGNLEPGDYNLIYNLFCVYNMQMYDSDTLEFTVFPGNDIKINETSVITVYPTPASNTIIIEVPLHLQVKNISLQSIDGRLIKTFGTSNTTLDISDIVKGQYILKIQTDKKEFFKKIIIQ